jgi:hypothetical protein
VKPVVIAAALSLLGLPAVAQQGAPAAEAPAVTKANTANPPNAVDVLFEHPQMKNVAPGTTLSYDYLRRSGIEKAPFGPPLQDQIRLRVEPGSAEDNRNIRVEMFSGMNRFPAGPFEAMPGNPVMTLFLEHHLQKLAGVLKSNPRYIKTAIRKALRDKAVITPVQVDFKGRQVEAWRIEAEPFVDDPNKERMRGMANLKYTFVTSASVPGELLSIEVQSKDGQGGELLEERLSYDQNAG